MGGSPSSPNGSTKQTTEAQPEAKLGVSTIIETSFDANWGENIRVIFMAAPPKVSFPSPSNKLTSSMLINVKSEMVLWRLYSHACTQPLMSLMALYPLIPLQITILTTHPLTPLNREFHLPY
jgi:hypothetical protein